MKYATAFFAMAILAFLSLTASAEDKYTFRVDRFTTIDAQTGDKMACKGALIVIRIDPRDSDFNAVGSARADFGCVLNIEPDDPGTDPDDGGSPDPTPPRPCNPTGTNPGPAPCPEP